MTTRFFLGSITILLCAATAPTLAIPSFLPAWQSRYPDSTLAARMTATTGSQCHVCHNPAAFGAFGNCYREDLALALQGGVDIATAIDELDGVDSDLDGFANGVEINMPHADLAEEVGYSPGLVGELGTDPCADSPDEIVTGVAETPLGLVPTVSEWGLVVMTLLLLTCGTLASRNRYATAG